MLNQLFYGTLFIVLNFGLTIFALLIATIIEIGSDQKKWIKVSFVVLLVLGGWGAWGTYGDNKTLLQGVGQISSMKLTMDSLKTGVDSLATVRDGLVNQVRSLSQQNDSILSGNDSLLSISGNLNTSLDSLVAVRNVLLGNVQELSNQHHSLLRANDSLFALSRTQLSGVLDLRFIDVIHDQSGQYLTTLMCRSRWPQDVQDISITLEFNNKYIKATIEQRTTTSILDVSCHTREFNEPSDKLSYNCAFLAKGNHLEIRIYSENPLAIERYKLHPQ